MRALTAIWAMVATAAALVAAPAAADWWYAIYDGDKHVGYCHVVTSTATLGGLVVTRWTTICEARPDKTGAYSFHKTSDCYRGDVGVVFYTANAKDKKDTGVIKATRTGDGFVIEIIKAPGEKKEKVENYEVPAASFDLVEPEEALAKLEAPGRKVEAKVLDLETGKISKGKLEYVADQTIDVMGAATNAKVIAAKGVFGGSTFWYAEDGTLIKVDGVTPAGKGLMVSADATTAQQLK